MSDALASYLEARRHTLFQVPISGSLEGACSEAVTCATMLQHGDIAAALDGLATRRTRRASLPDAATRARRMPDEELAKGAADDSFPLKLARIMADIRQALGDADIALADTGSAKTWMARLCPTRQPNTCIVSDGLSTMTFALPGAMADKMAFPERRVHASMRASPSRVRRNVRGPRSIRRTPKLSSSSLTWRDSVAFG